MKRGYDDNDDELVNLFDDINVYDEVDEYNFLSEGANYEMEDEKIMKRAIDRYRRYIRRIYFEDDIVYIKEMIIEFLNNNDFQLISKIDNSILNYITRTKRVKYKSKTMSRK